MLIPRARILLFAFAHFFFRDTFSDRMTLTATLQNMPDIELVPLNFSSATTPALLLKTFDQYCEYSSGRGGQVTLRPRGGRANPHKWPVHQFITNHPVSSTT